MSLIWEHLEDGAEGYGRCETDYKERTMMIIANLAQLQRAIKAPGVNIRVVQHWQPHLVGTTRQPKTTRNSGKRGIQTNGYYFDGVDYQGKACEMFAGTPKAAELAFNSGGTVTFHPGTSKSWTLAFEGTIGL